jgi:hypothetical protein
MKLKLLLLTGLLFGASVEAAFPVSIPRNTDSCLVALDGAIEQHKIYATIREQRIHRLKDQLKGISPSDENIYKLNNALYLEYKSYTCDSALYYLNRNMKWAEKYGNPYLIDKTRIMLAHLMSSVGMYEEASERLGKLSRAKLPAKLLPDYYDCYCLFYGEVGAYTQDELSKDGYLALSRSYRDSLLQLLPIGSYAYMEVYGVQKMAKGDISGALQANDAVLARLNGNTPEFALAAYIRSRLFRKLGDKDSEIHFLALSALADIHVAITDHASLWNLAQLLYERGDIERAYRYMRFSWDQTRFYNARLRSWQSADVLSLIDKTYQAMIERQNKRLEQYVMAITILLVLLLGALFYIYWQMKKLATARNNLQVANEQLKTLNENLRSLNLDLSEANQIKEEYIARFVKLCSTYIDKLDAYRRMVNKKLSAGQIAELFKITRSQKTLDGELEELYMNFDSAFLHIFPDFVEQFNTLLQDDAQIVLKSRELLNTELRIFALIRLGIEDSSQIAEFLRYSVNTIYNYRAKVKNKSSVARDNFEEMVKAIR